MPGNTTSTAYFALPLTFVSPSTRGVGLPTTCFDDAIRVAPMMRESLSDSGGGCRLEDPTIIEAASESGSPGGTRTPDQLVNSQLLYRLSYRGSCVFFHGLTIYTDPPSTELLSFS